METIVKNNKDQYYPVCMMNAISGPVSPPPDVPDVPPNINCDAGWHFLVDDNVCLMLDVQQRAWEASQANCQSFGGNLVSINSPQKQIEVFKITGLDPSATGKIRYYSILDLTNMI